MLKKFSIHVGLPVLIALSALFTVSVANAQTMGTGTDATATGSSLTGSVNGTSSATGTTPGLPNTGLGGGNATVMSLLLGSAVVLGVGSTLLSRRFIS